MAAPTQPVQLPRQVTTIKNRSEEKQTQAARGPKSPPAADAPQPVQLDSCCDLGSSSIEEDAPAPLEAARLAETLGTEPDPAHLDDRLAAAGYAEQYPPVDAGYFISPWNGQPDAADATTCRLLGGFQPPPGLAESRCPSLAYGLADRPPGAFLVDVEPHCPSMPCGLADRPPGAFLADVPPGLPLPGASGAALRELVGPPSPCQPRRRSDDANWVGSCAPRADELDCYAIPPRLAGEQATEAVGAQGMIDEWWRHRGSAGNVSRAMVAREYSVTMQPGLLRLSLIATTGNVTNVTPGGQAAEKGVQPGWRLVSLDGEPYHESLLRSKITSSKPYNMAFSVEEGIAPALMAARFDHSERSCQRWSAANQDAQMQMQEFTVTPNMYTTLGSDRTGFGHHSWHGLTPNKMPGDFVGARFGIDYGNSASLPPLWNPLNPVKIDDCIIEKNGQRALAARARSSGRGTNAADPCLQHRPRARSCGPPSAAAGATGGDLTPRGPPREAQRRYQTQRKKQQRQRKKQIRRGEAQERAEGLLPSPRELSGCEGEPLPQAVREVLAQVPDGEPAPAEGACLAAAQARDLHHPAAGASTRASSSSRWARRFQIGAVGTIVGSTHDALGPSG